MRAVLCGFYGKGNGGDEALLASLLQMLPPHVEPVVLSGNPSETQRCYGVEAQDRFSLPTVMATLQRSDAFIWGGGSLMQDATSRWNPLYYGGLMALAQRLGLRTIAWAQGIGPLNRSATRWLTRHTFSRCTAVSVRDAKSAALLAEWQVDFTLAPDPVWALESQPVPGLWDLPAPRVAVALRSHPLLTPDRLTLLTQALIDFQKTTDACLLLLPFHPALDLEIAQTIQPQLPGVSRVLTLTDPQQLMGVFKGVELTIAMRLHGLIMSAASGCRSFALSYDPKVSQLMQELDLPGWELDHLPTTARAMTQTWVNYFANGEPLSKAQIGARVDRALIHQEVLAMALEPDRRKRPLIP